MASTATQMERMSSCSLSMMMELLVEDIGQTSSILNGLIQESNVLVQLSMATFVVFSMVKRSLIADQPTSLFQDRLPRAISQLVLL